MNLECGLNVKLEIKHNFKRVNQVGIEKSPPYQNIPLMALTPLLKHTLKMKKEFNPPIKIYPFSLESQNGLVPIKIGYLIDLPYPK